MDKRLKGMELLLQGTVLLVLIAQACAIRSEIFSGDPRHRRSNDGSKQVYLFLKLWSPPLLHYHEGLSNQPPKPDSRRPSPYAFYHTYGKRSHNCQHNNPTDDRFREYARSIRRTQKSPVSDYLDDADW